MNWYSLFFFLSLLGVVQGVILAVLLLKQRIKASPLPALMGLLFLSGSLAMLIITLTNAGVVSGHPLLTTIEYTLGLLTGPLLWLTVKKLHGGNVQIPFLHFLPALFYLILSTTAFQIPVLWVMIHLQGYSLFAFFHFLRLRKKHIKSSQKKYHRWIGLLLGFYLFVGLSQWIRFGFSQYKTLDLIIPMTASIHLYIVVIAGFSHSYLMDGWKKGRASAPTLPPPDLNRLNELILQIKERQLFRRESLTVSELARQLELLPHELSSLINQQVEGGFPVLINQLRVEYAQQLLIDPDYDYLSIAGISREAGFKSRSSFYQSFRQQCRMTPSQYRKKMSGFSKSGQVQA